MTELCHDRVLYLYGIVSSDRAMPLVGGATLEVVAFSALAAVVEPVPRDEFSPEALERRLAHLDWVAPLACKHAAVLDEIMRSGPIIPARLCTLFTSERALADALSGRAPEFRDALELLDGRQEWGCKLFYDEARVRALAAGHPGVAALASAAATANPGHAYVLRRQRDARLAEVAAARVDAAVSEVLGEIEPEIADVRFRALLAEAATGRPEPMALNAALLIDVERADALHAAAGALSSRLCSEGFTLELTGPWPPYSFCAGDPVADAGERA